MSDNETGPDRFQVVVNDEEQYSIWPEDRTVPKGWRADGVVGTKEHCLDHIEEVWTDMRPLSLRTRMADRQSSVAG